MACHDDEPRDAHGWPSRPGAFVRWCVIAFAFCGAVALVVEWLVTDA